MPRRKGEEKNIEQAREKEVRFNVQCSMLNVQGEEGSVLYL
jgi:hypothetical protein